MFLYFPTMIRSCIKMHDLIMETYHFCYIQLMFNSVLSICNDLLLNFNDFLLIFNDFQLNFDDFLDFQVMVALRHPSSLTISIFHRSNGHRRSKPNQFSYPTGPSKFSFFSMSIYMPPPCGSWSIYMPPLWILVDLHAPPCESYKCCFT